MSYTFPPARLGALPGWGLWLSGERLTAVDLIRWSAALPLAVARDLQGAASGVDYLTVRVYVPDELWKAMAVMESAYATRMEVLSIVHRAVQRRGPALLGRLGTLYRLGADARALYALVDSMGAT